MSTSTFRNPIEAILSPENLVLVYNTPKLFPYPSTEGLFEDVIIFGEYPISVIQERYPEINLDAETNGWRIGYGTECEYGPGDSDFYEFGITREEALARLENELRQNENELLEQLRERYEGLPLSARAALLATRNVCNRELFWDYFGDVDNRYYSPSSPELAPFERYHAIRTLSENRSLKQRERFRIARAMFLTRTIRDDE